MTSFDAAHSIIRHTGIPDGWIECALSEVVQIVGGGTPDRSEGAYWRDGGIPWITPTDLTANDRKYITQGAEYISEAGLQNSNATLIPRGAIVFSTRGTVGNIAIAGIPLTCNQSCEILVPRTEEFDSDFLYYLLVFGMSAFHRLSGGTTFSAITRRDIGRVRFAFPPPHEQAAIARILDAVDTAIERTREALDAVQTLRTSITHEAISLGIDKNQYIRKKSEQQGAGSQITKLGQFPRDWRITTLGKVCSKIVDGIHQSVVTSREGIPFLYVSCIRHGRVYWNRAARVNERDYAIISKGRKPKKGAVLYTAVGSYGHAAVVENDAPFSFQRHIAILYPKEQNLDPFFLATWINSSKGRRWSDIVAVGNAQKTVTLAALGKFPIALPSFEEQLRIRELLEPINKLVDAKEEKLLALEQLKKSLMHDLFTGKVRVGDSGLLPPP